MSKWRNFPVVYEINTWVWLNYLSQKYDSQITLGIVPVEELKSLVDYGFDAVWLMGVWKRSVKAREISLKIPYLLKEYNETLPDYSPEDVAGSAYAIYGYRVDERLGGDKELEVIRKQLNSLGLKLILDFVPNHMAIDHPWLTEHPEYFVQGSQEDIRYKPGEYFTKDSGEHHWIFAHGRTHDSCVWTDTIQLDYRNKNTRERMSYLLLSLSNQCDGVRCDMPMLIINDHFRYTWGGEFNPPDAEFWPIAIQRVKSLNPDFLMIAEVYWDFEYRLQQQGFDYTYDRVFYERLLAGSVESLLEHLHGGSFDFQRRLVRFIENHDEKRSLYLFGSKRCRTAATLASTLPGLRLFHQGQLNGARLNLPVQLGRWYKEDPVEDIVFFYKRLLTLIRDPIFHEGKWLLLKPQAVSPENPTYKNIIAFQWTKDEERRLIVVNLINGFAKCILPLDMPGLAGHSWCLVDLLEDAKKIDNMGNIYKGDEILNNGLYLDLSAYGYHIYAFQLAD